MFNSNAQQEFKVLLKAFNAAKYAEYQGYAYSAGYMESLVVDMLGSLGKKEQKFFIAEMQKAVDKIPA
jgi:hypothetical protein